MTHRTLTRIALLTGLTGFTLACGSGAAVNDGPMPTPDVEPPKPVADTGKPPPPGPPDDINGLPHDDVEDAVLCLTPDDARRLTPTTETCPKSLDTQDARPLAESWGRRTGGPWIEQVLLLKDASNEERCCYEQTFKKKSGSGPTKGRPLMVDGGVRVPRLDGPAGRGAAARWREDAQMEASSVSAFVRAAAELEAAGAPAELVERCLAAAEDEARHTRLCLGVARTLDGLDPELGDPPDVVARPLDLVQLAVTTLLEGALPETLAAAEARLAARRCTTPEIRAVLHTIAVDEQRHADLGWAVIGWARRVGGAAVDEALVDALTTRSVTVDEARVEQLAESGATEARHDGAGRLGDRVRQQLIATLTRGIVAPLTHALLAA